MLANCMQIAAHNLVSSVIELKSVTFIAGRSENPAEQNFLIRFFIDNLIANISLYAFSWPKFCFIKMDTTSY